MNKDQLDWLAEEAMSAIKDGNPDLNDYWHAEKRSHLAGLQRLAVLIWMNTLDVRNLSLVAERVDVPLADLQTTIKTVARL